MKRIFLLIILLLLTSCKYESAPVPDEAAFLIGQVGAISGTPISVNREVIVRAAGGKLITEVNDFSSDGTLAAIESLIAKGCEGIIFTPMSESMLPQITKICEEAHVYWVISMRPINDPETRQIVEASPYFVGSVFENDEAAGYEIMRILAQSGVKETALISISRLNSAVEARERGLNKAAEEFGIKIVAEVRNCHNREDITRAVNNFIEVYPDLDAIFRVAAYVWGGLPDAVDSILASNRCNQIKLASIDSDMITENHFDKNCIAVVADGHIALDASIATAMLVNAVTGHPIQEDGPLSFSVDYIFMRSGEDFKALSMYGGEKTPFFSEEQARSLLLKQYNPSITAEDYQKIIDNYTIEKMHRIFE